MEAFANDGLDAEALPCMNKPAPNKLKVSVDEACVLQYLYLFPNEFLTEMEIARRANGKSHFKEEQHWVHCALSRLASIKLVETDGLGRYRATIQQVENQESSKKFLAPHLRAILERKGGAIDLSKYA